MRRWLLILMVALLPLRVWAGDVMAAQMLVQQVQAVTLNAAQNAAEEAPAATHADCLGHAGTGDPADDAVTQVDCSTCTSCQVCHTVALVALPDMGALPQVHAGPPATRVLPYASALVALGFKPPIS